MTKCSMVDYCIKAFDDLANSDGLVVRARVKSCNFTRNRKMNCKSLFMLIVGGIRLSLQLAVDDFFKTICQKENIVSKQAFSKARGGFDANVIKELFQETAAGFCKCDDRELWKGKYQLFAIDGSDVALDNAKPLKAYFGCCDKAKTATTAMLSVAFDPLNNFILDASLDPYATTERDAAKAHIDAVCRLLKDTDVEPLFLMDRGYPSKDFLAQLCNGSMKFLIRVRRKFNIDFDAVKKDDTVLFELDGCTYHVRVIKVILNTGETETLVTNLGTDELSYEEAGTLYFSRWKIETKYDSLKNKLQFGNFSGRRVITILQDFWATMYLANLLASIEFQTNSVIAAKSEGKQRTYTQTTNENRLIHKFRFFFFPYLIERSFAKRLLILMELIDDVAKRPEDVKPGRYVKRKTPRKMKNHDRRKAVM